jgi:cytochrome P450
MRVSKLSRGGSNLSGGGSAPPCPPGSATARDPRYWSDPERFLNETEKIKNNKAASIPFGGGHRQCPGQDLARFELKVICARLMQHVTFIDGGPEVNSGGYKQRDIVQPKHIDVAIKFD